MLYVERILSRNRGFLRVVGLWPPDIQESPRFSKAKGYFISTIIISIAILLIVFSLATNSTIAILAERSVETIGIVQVSWKSVAIIIFRNDTLELLYETKMRVARFKDEEKIIESWLHLRAVLTKYIIAVYVCCTLVYISFPLTLPGKALPFMMDVQPFTASPWYELTYILETMGVVALFFGVLSADILCVLFVCHLCSELQCSAALMRLNGTVDRNYMKSFIAQHIEAMRYGEKVCRYLSLILFFQNFAMTSGICIIAYVLITNRNSLIKVKMFVVLLTNIIQLLVNCSVGETIFTVSSGIRCGIEESNWPSCRVEDRKTICYALLRSQKPLSIGVGNFGVCNLKFFSSAVYTALSYTAILINLS